MKRIFLILFCCTLPLLANVPGFAPEDLAVLNPASGISGVSQIPNLVAYWKLDEGNNTTREDSTANNHDLTEPVGGDVPSSTGKINDAAGVFSGNSYLLNADSAFNFGSSDFTVCAWVNVASLSQAAYPGVMSKVDPTTDETDSAWHISFHDANDTFYGIAYTAASGGTAGTLLVWGSAVSTSTWYWICFWRDGNTLYFSVNNGTPVSGAFTGAMFDSTATYKMGTRKGNDSSNQLNGLVDETAVFSRALTADERAAIFNGGSALPY